MMMEEEFAQAEQLRGAYAEVGVMPQALEIARVLFADENSPGMIRLKEHSRVENVELVETGPFSIDIRTLFLTLGEGE